MLENQHNNEVVGTSQVSILIDFLRGSGFGELG